MEDINAEDFITPVSGNHYHGRHHRDGMWKWEISTKDTGTDLQCYNVARFLHIQLNMTSQGNDGNNVDWEALFYQETPEHICNSIAATKNEIFGEFQLRLDPEVAMSNYCV